jgi:hypothetical protein
MVRQRVAGLLIAAVLAVSACDSSSPSGASPRLPRERFWGQAEARVVPASAKPGESITLTPAAPVGRECGGGIAFYRPFNASEVELVGLKNGGWNTPPMTHKACEPLLSDRPETAVVPNIAAGDYVVCVLNAGDPLGCAKLAVVS